MTGPDTTSTLVDPSYLAELDTMLGREMTDTLVAPMLIELESVPYAVRDLLAAGNIIAAKSVAHGLRGAALGLGCVRVADLCARIETGSTDTLPGWAAELSPIAQQTIVALRAARGPD